jgi:hypothetical protein
MSDKEQPNTISVKTATITESHEDESSVTEAVDGNKAKDSDSNKRKLQDRGSTSDDQSFEKEKLYFHYCGSEKFFGNHSFKLCC